MIGFSDDGVEALTTGTWTFRGDGTHAFDGTIEFPRSPCPAQGTGIRPVRRWIWPSATPRAASGDVEHSEVDATRLEDGGARPGGSPGRAAFASQPAYIPPVTSRPVTITPGIRWFTRTP